VLWRWIGIHAPDLVVIAGTQVFRHGREATSPWLRTRLTDLRHENGV